MNHIALCFFLLVVVSTLFVVHDCRTFSGRKPSKRLTRYDGAQYVYSDDEVSDDPANLQPPRRRRIPSKNADIVAYSPAGNSNDGTGEDNVAEQGISSKGLQVMITKKMRRILIDDLGYHEDEVDDMEPQIAAVLIERKLNRPKKGIPASWRKSGSVTKKNQLEWQSVVQHITETAGRAVDFARQNVLPFLPVILLGGALYFQRETLIYMARNIWSSAQDVKLRITQRANDAKQRREAADRERIVLGTIRVPSRGSSKSESNSKSNPFQRKSSNNAVISSGKSSNNGRVNLRAYNMASKRSFLDDLDIHSSIWRKKNGW